MRIKLLALLLVLVVVSTGCLEGFSTVSDKKDNKVTVIRELKLGQGSILAGATTFAEMDFINLGSRKATHVNAELADACLLNVSSIICNHPNATTTKKGCFWEKLERLDGSVITWWLEAPEFHEEAVLRSCSSVAFKVNFTYSSNFSIDIAGARKEEVFAGEQTQAKLNAQSDYAPVIPRVAIGSKQPVPVGVPFSLVIKLENVERGTDGRVVNDVINKDVFKIKFDPDKIEVVSCPDFTKSGEYWSLNRELELKNDGKETLPIVCRIQLKPISVPKDTFTVNFELSNLGYEFTRELPMTILPKPNI